MCYLVEREYDLSGNLTRETRVSGDIRESDMAYAKHCMEHLFHFKVIENRHIVVGGSLAYTDTKCTMQLKTGQYEVAIVSL